MKVKELIERLQSLDQELEAYIWNEKEHSLFSVEDIYKTSDFGENDKGENEWEDFVTISPSSNSQPLFTLTPEEVEILGNIVAKEYLDMQYLIKTNKNDKLYVNIMRDKATMLDNLLTRIKQFQDEYNITGNF